MLENTVYECPGSAGIGALKRPVVLSDVKGGRMSRGVYGYIITPLSTWYNCNQVTPLSVERHNPQVFVPPLAAYTVVVNCELEVFGSIAIVLMYVPSNWAFPKALLQVDPPSNERKRPTS